MPSSNIASNLIRAYYKLYCKGDPYRFSGERDHFYFGVIFHKSLSKHPRNYFKHKNLPQSLLVCLLRDHHPRAVILDPHLPLITLINLPPSINIRPSFPLIPLNESDSKSRWGVLNVKICGNKWKCIVTHGWGKIIYNVKQLLTVNNLILNTL